MSADLGGQRAAALIALLADGELHSGERIAEHLGMTRAAVWKALRKLSDELGLTVESVRGRGYRLSAPLELLDRDRLLASMTASGRDRLSSLELHAQIDSTNAYLMRAAARGAPSGTACLAERQTAGRGRRGRAWVSPFGVNLYLSLLWRYPLAPSALGGMSLAAGAVVAHTLLELGASGLALKWPNDILWRRRKLAGLLLEVTGESQGPSQLVLGLGLNLRMASAQGCSIDQPWATLEEVTSGSMPGRNLLAARLLEALTAGLDRFGREGLEPFLASWRELDPFIGEPARLFMGERVIEGRLAGIARDGGLRLETSDGLRVLQAGEVSLRPHETDDE